MPQESLLARAEIALQIGLIRHPKRSGVVNHEHFPRIRGALARLVQMGLQNIDPIHVFIPQEPIQRFELGLRATH
jgi:hypothetical protein